MTILINDVPPRVHYVATHGQTVFQIPFEWLKNSDVIVYVNEVIATFDAPPLDAMHYSLTGENTEGGGTLTFGVPGRLAGDQVIITRDMHIDSPVDFPTSGVFPVASLNAAFDEMTAGIQQAEIGYERRALRMWKNDFLYQINPIPMSYARAGKLLGFDANGHPVAVGKDEVGGGGEGSGARVWTGDDPPPLPWKDGDLWWESDSGKLFVFYEDGDSGQWVETSSGGGSSGSSNAITPQMFGALGNGIADETVQVQQAINAGIAQKRPVVIRGTFRCGAVTSVYLPTPPAVDLSVALTVNGPLTIYGDGGTLVPTGQCAVLFITSSDVLVDGLTITGAGNGAFNTQGRLIYATGIQNAAAVAPTYLFNISVTNCKLSLSGRNAIHLDYVQNFRVTDNTITQVGYMGIEVRSSHIGQIVDNSVSDVTPGDPSKSPPQMYGIALGSANTSDLVQHPTCTRISADHNRIVNSQWEGLDCHGGDRLSFSFNYLRLCGATNAAIALAHRDSGSGDTDAVDPATNIRVIGNVIRESPEWAISSSNGNPTGTGTLTVDHLNWVIANNVIEDCGNASLTTFVGGLRIMAVKGCSISGNVLRLVKGYGIYVGSPRADAISIVGNTFIDVVSTANTAPTAIHIQRGAASLATAVVTVVGNSLAAGAAAAAFKNIRGLALDTANDAGLLRAGINSFDAAVTKYSISNTRHGGSGEPVTNVGFSAVPVVTTSPTGSLVVTLPNVHSSGSCWSGFGVVSNAPGNAPTIVEVVRTSASQITIAVRTANGANFPTAGNVNVNWRTGGF